MATTRDILGLIAAAMLAGAVANAAAAPATTRMIEVRAWIEPARDVYPVNESLRYIIEARWNMALPDVTVNISEVPDLEELACEGWSKSETVSPENSENSARFCFTLQPLSTRPAHIGPALLRASRGGGEEENLTVAGRAVPIGPPAYSRLREMGIGVGIAAAFALLFGGWHWLHAWRKRRAAAMAADAPVSSPLAALQARYAELDRLLVDDGAAEYCGRIREILGQALRDCGAIGGPIPTANEFGGWLEARSSEERELYSPCLILLEQIERVRFAGWKPTAEENHAMRKQLERIVERLEQALVRQESMKEMRKS